MTHIRSEVIQKWWPTTQALDLVEGNVEEVAAAVHNEVARFVGKEVITGTWETFSTVDEAFGAAPEFANVPTFYLMLPTHSKWTVLWNNSFLCNGYDSLCHCLTSNHALTTVHWQAHDGCTSMQSEAKFCHRRAGGGNVIERSVQVMQEDGRWAFTESGEQLVEEDVQLYTARRKRDRLNEDRLLQLLARLGALPWSEQFYALPKHCYVIRRSAAPSTIIKRRREDVLKHG